MRIVFDTNVLISAFLWQGQLKPIYDLIRSNHLTPCFNQNTWNKFQVISFMFQESVHKWRFWEVFSCQKPIVFSALN